MSQVATAPVHFTNTFCPLPYLEALEAVRQVLLDVGVGAGQELERQVRQVLEGVRLDHVQVGRAAVAAAIGNQVQNEPVV